jgi:hypothetical protein
LANNQTILKSCDAAHPPASWVAIDGTGSSASNSILSERMTALQSIVQTTAVCSGYLMVQVFSADSAATTTLFDGSMLQTGATTNARLQRVPKAVDTVMTTVQQAYPSAVAGLDARDSDITGQYANAAQWFGQLGGAYRLHVYLLTDGFQTAGVNLSTQPLNQEQALALAQQTSVPTLPGAEIVVAGLGRIVGPTPPSDMVAGLVAYYTALCHRMNAATCISVTDYQAAGW